MTDRVVVMTLARIEAQSLADLVAQFSELLDERNSPDNSQPADPALLRLTPDAYPGDAEASDEFRSATEGDLLDRREADALRVLADLAPSFSAPDAPPMDASNPASDTVSIELDVEGGWAWMRTLTAIRLVIATRLGITDEDDRDESDERFGVYDWLGYRLDGLVQAVSDR